MRVIDDKENQLGVIDAVEARKLAESRELDLVEVAPNANPPVARVMDFGKFQYEQAKQKTKSKAKAGQVKEIRLSMKIGEHDLRYRLERAKGFLDEGHKVRFNVMMKGRENANPRRGIERVKYFVNLLDGVKMENEPVRQGRSISVIVTPAKNTSKPIELKEEPSE